jgi:hypothetical protein
MFTSIIIVLWITITFQHPFANNTIEILIVIELFSLAFKGVKKSMILCTIDGSPNIKDDHWSFKENANSMNYKPHHATSPKNSTMMRYTMFN